MRPARFVGLLVSLGCAACASTVTSLPALPVSPLPGASAAALALVESSAHRRIVRTFPAYTKMSLVKLLPREAPALAELVDSVLFEERYARDVAARVDAALGPDGVGEALAAVRDVDVAFMLDLLAGSSHARTRPEQGDAKDSDLERLFDHVAPPAQTDRIARLPLASAARVGLAALSPDDARRDELAGIAAIQPTLSRVDARRAFVQMLKPARSDEVGAALACFTTGPCARAHDVILQAHEAAAAATTAELEARVGAELRARREAARAR